MRRTLACCVLILVVGCASSESVAEGVVIDFVGDLSAVEEFTVRTADGDLTFRPAVDIDAEFPLPHLREHLTTGDPVRVIYVSEGGELVATAVEDG